MKRSLRYLLLIAVLVISLTACSSKTEDLTGEVSVVAESADAESADAEEETAEPEEEAPVYINYLTGLETTEEYAALRPVAVMIPNDNYGALPHVGIAAADVVYQILAEGGYTRLMAIYSAQAWMNTETIGPVRSSRLYYCYYAQEFDSIYVHYGQSYLAKDYLNSGEIDNINGLYDSAFTRDSSRTSPNNAFTGNTLLSSVIASKGYDTELSSDYTGTFNFADEEVTLDDGFDAWTVTPYYPIDKPWFEYNEEDGLYYRFQYGEAHVDEATGEQLAYKNIIIISVPTEVADSEHGYLELDVTGTGEGYYITNGKAIEITWSKDSLTAVTKYYDSDGNEISLNTGKTFICVQSNAAFEKVTFEGKEE